VKDKLAWARALDQLLTTRVEAVPPGWRSAEDLAKEMDLCYEMAKIKCRDLVKAGLAERKDFRVKWGRGARLRPFYRLVTPAARKGAGSESGRSFRA